MLQCPAMAPYAVEVDGVPVSRGLVRCSHLERHASHTARFRGAWFSWPLVSEDPHIFVVRRDGRSA